MVTISENTKHGFDVLNRKASKHGSIKTALYNKDHKLIKIYNSNKDLAEDIKCSITNVCKNRYLNDNNISHNRGCGIYLIHKKYFCKTYIEESVETIEQDIKIA